MEIKKLNPISGKVNDILTSDNYTITDDAKNPVAILVRSFSMHEYAIEDSCIAVARAGAGVNNIPIPALTEKGVCVFNTPGANANAVKELVMCALLLGSRKLIPAINWVQNLEKNDEVGKVVEKGKKAFIGPEIYGKTLGIVGMGAIGRLVSEAAIAMGMTIVGYDPFMPPAFKKMLNPNITIVDNLDALYAQADYITLHTPATAETKGSINKESIAKMKDGVVIVNCARGELFNDNDVVEAVLSGKIARIVTDLPNKNLIGYENIITFPHLGASTPEAEDNCAVMAANELKDFIENGNVTNSVNFPNLKVSKTKSRITVLTKNETAAKEVLSTINAACTSATRGDLTYIIADVDDENANVIKALEDISIKVRFIK